jgi:hypothetical protein
MLLAAVLALMPLSASADPCPESCLNGDCTAAMTRDTVVTIVCEPFAPVEGGRGNYDLVSGRLHAEAHGCSGWYGPGGGYVSVRASDRFRLVGPSGGGPVAFQARLQLSGGAGGFAGTCGGDLVEVGGASASANDGGLMYLATTLAIPITHQVGDEFRLDCYVSASAGGSGGLGFVDAQLSFAGLPPGYGVTSCQGYAGDGAVSNLPASWGALKLRYR